MHYSLKHSALPPQMSPFRDSAVSFFGARADARASGTTGHCEECGSAHDEAIPCTQAQPLGFAHHRSFLSLGIASSQSLLAMTFLFLLCLLSSPALQAQDSLSTDVVSIIKPFPSDLDSVKVDSFFKQRGIDMSTVVKREMYYEIFRWYKTCYRYGGNTDKGIDCSHFVNMLYEKIYGHRLSSSSGAIAAQCTRMKKGYVDAEEGDLVFFAIKKKRVSHVAIYLQNGKFAHATTQAGVIISDKDEPYYKKHFYRVGRVE